MEDLVKDILRWMYDFIEDEEDPDYNQKDVKECEVLLNKFINDVRNEHQSAINAVKNLVLELNKLNEKCNYCLIETDQREQICELIFSVLEQNNVSYEGDITEEWREW